jgi:hypothetical protein
VHALRRGVAAFILVTAAAVVPVLAGAASPAAAGGNGNGSGQCTVDLGGQWITVQCGYGGGGGGGGGGSGGGGGTKVVTTCTFVPLTQQGVVALGLPWPAPKGYAWELMTCLGGHTGGGTTMAQLVNVATGVPQVTPQELLQQALNELEIPTIRPGTAPPPGRDGLVGLPEWFWVPRAQWRTVSVTVSAGPVWATATATPVGLTFEPGGGLAPVNCTGPGRAYNEKKPAAQQHTRCEFTYDQSSAGQPGNAYQASVAVTWNVSWTGSGGTGGELNPGLIVPFPFALPIAQGEALVTTP